MDRKVGEERKLERKEGGKEGMREERKEIAVTIHVKLTPRM